MSNEKLTNKNKTFISTNPPAKLAELIEMMNFVPGNFQLPDAKKVLERVFYELTGTAALAEWIIQNAFYKHENLYIEEMLGIDSTNCFEALRATIEVIRYDLNKHSLFIDKILPETTNSGVYFEVWEMYEEYYQLRSELFAIISHLEQFKKYDFDKTKIPFNTAFSLSAVNIIFDFDENGNITFQNSFLIQALEGADVRRLRRCDVCQSILWAYRSNTRFCSKKCADVYFQRLKRLGISTKLKFHS